MRRTLALLAAITMVLQACGGGDNPGPASSTTARPVPTTPRTTPDDTTTSAAERCAPVSLPPTASDTNEAAGDVDGDGASDAMRTYRLADGDWHLQVALAAGGGSDLAITTFGESSVVVLGGADVDHDGRDEIWARTGSGASATILGLVRLRECELERVAFEGGDPAELPVGGSVGTASGVECDARAGSATHLTTYVASNIGGDQYEVTATAHSLEGSVLVKRGSTTTNASIGDELFSRATGFSCGDLTL